jgi:hypothetical protein
MNHHIFQHGAVLGRERGYETVWAFDFGHPLRLERCPSLAGAGEGGRRPGEGRWGKTNFCRENRGEVSKLGNQKTAVRRGNEFLHQAPLLIPAEFAETKNAAGRRRMWHALKIHPKGLCL